MSSHHAPSHSRPRPRLSPTVTEPFDPVYSYNFDASGNDGASHRAQHRAQTPPSPVSYPFSPYESPATGGMPPVGVYGGEFFEGPEHSPRLQPTAMPNIRPTAGSTAEVPSMGEWISPPLPPTVVGVGTPPLGRQNTFWSSSTRNRGDGGVGDVPLSTMKTVAGVEVEERTDKHADAGPDHRASARMSRHGSLATRLGRSIIGSVGLSRTSAAMGTGRWPTVRRSRMLGDEDYTELGRLGGGEAPIGMDVSTFGPEFTVPHQTAMAMETAGFNEDLAYTGGSLLRLDADGAGLIYSRCRGGN